MALKLITAPDQIVTLADAKKHCNVSGSADDDYIEALIAVATAEIDGKTGWLGRALGEQTWDLILDEFPPYCGNRSGGIRIPLPPLQAVTFVKYVDATTGLEATVDEDDYYVDTASEPGWVMPDTNGWPVPMCTVNAVRVRFVAGYAEDAVPAPIKHAILLSVGSLYRHKGDEQLVRSVEIPDVETRQYVASEKAAELVRETADRLLSGYRVFT